MSLGPRIRLEARHLLPIRLRERQEAAYFASVPDADGPRFLASDILLR